MAERGRYPPPPLDPHQNAQSARAARPRSCALRLDPQDSQRFADQTPSHGRPSASRAIPGREGATIVGAVRSSRRGATHCAYSQCFRFSDTTSHTPGGATPRASTRIKTKPRNCAGGPPRRRRRRSSAVVARPLRGRLSKPPAEGCRHTRLTSYTSPRQARYTAAVPHRRPSSLTWQAQREPGHLRPGRDGATRMAGLLGSGMPLTRMAGPTQVSDSAGWLTRTWANSDSEGRADAMTDSDGGADSELGCLSLG